ncbi:MAG TPA: hypothetical protein VGC99_05630 [Candidatus Tectomicrobia bacterium]
MGTEAGLTASLHGAFQRFDLVQDPGRPEALKSAICEQTTRRCLEHFGGTLRAIILTGSLARDEATFVEEGNGWSLLGDVEFVLIFDEGAPLPPVPGIDLLREKIEEGLLQQNIRGHVSLSAVYPAFLRRLRPRIFAYELRTCGQVVWGDRQILFLIPIFSPSDIPLEDAWRLLCNRMVELLEVADELAGTPATLSWRVYYRTVKLYLDMATSYLVFVGAYEPTYRGRAEKLYLLADSATPGDALPFPLADFAERVIACTQAKLLGPRSSPLLPFEVREKDKVALPLDGGGEGWGWPGKGPGMAFWEEAVAYARSLWRWELARLTGEEGQQADSVLMKSWMQRQPFHHRLRGWLYVLRQRGWHRSWRDWPRWGRRGWQASPRYLVYAAATELFFRLARLLVSCGETRHPDFDCETLRRLLPVARTADRWDERPALWRLASDIVWNYHEFVQSTLA